MAVQKDGTLTSEMGQGFCGSRVAVALVIGVPLCCVLALLYTNGELPVYDWPTRLGRLSGSGYQTGSTSSESQGRVDALSSVIVSQAEKITELEMRVENLTEKLRLAEKIQDDARKQLRPGPLGTVKGLANPTVIPNDTVNPRLAELLKEVAVGKELIVALANSNVRETLEIWFTSIKRVGIPNYMVVALDNETAEFCRSNEVPVYQRDPDQEIDVIGKTGTNSAVSGLKFRILREFLQLGYSVLLSDADVVYLQNPFDHLYRDSDVESMSDGHDNGTAYGYNDVFNDPVMGRSSIIFTRRIWDYNAGFFYIRPTMPSIELLDRVTGRLILQPGAWDQAVYNEELFYPSHPGYEGLHIAKRTMDYYLFMNSKVLFREVRKDAQLSEMKPVIVHLNYHGDKLPRMKAVVEFYFDGNKDALQPFPDGS